MLKHKRIVVPTDFSERSLSVLPFATGLAEQFGAEIELVHIHEPLPSVSDLAWSGSSEASRDEQEFQRAKRSLEKLVEERVPKTVKAGAVILRGDTVRQLVKYMSERGVGLMVMATHGRGGIMHALMGSVAEAMVRKAPCPVLTLKQPADVEKKKGQAA